ncbi:TBC1 domain family member 15-like [Tubulanus polymorphus]|uniref:TBC1 domain family member 15-like n=1 Tax=Tubulanus polymorphus TaxID=672921 RepID=UPI003DA60977
MMTAKINNRSESFDSEFEILVGDEFEHVRFPPPKSDDLNGDNNDTVVTMTTTETSHRRPALTAEEFAEFRDEDGRIVDEHALRKAVFKGGVDPAIRREVWQFVFGLYPCTTTLRERQVLLSDYQAKYSALKNRWKTWLAMTSNSGDMEEVGLTAPYLPDLTAGGTGSPADTTPTTNVQQLQFVDIQAQVYAGRLTITDIDQLRNYIRIIDKDVPRTDRNVLFYLGDKNPNLLLLRDVLVTYATFHPRVGYTQGMNDILSRFLYVFQNEVEAYWCFNNYLDKIQSEFLEEGMVRKLELLQQLLKDLDEDLYNYLVQTEVGDLMFCHRWLILGFKREFSYDDSLRCFEILSSQHLELCSMEAEQMLNKERQKDFQQQGGSIRMADAVFNTEYTFDLFMCVGILIEYRDRIFKCTDCADVFFVVNSLSLNMDLDVVLTKAEGTFHAYCRKLANNSFEFVDFPATGAATKQHRRLTVKYIPDMTPLQSLMFD